MNKLSIIILLIIYLGNALYANPGQVQFIENKKQWDAQILYKADLPGGALFLTKNRLVYSFHSLSDLEKVHELRHKNKNPYQEIIHQHAYELNFLNANANPSIIPGDKCSEYHNYFIGNDPSKWASYVALYKKRFTRII
ncbi:MAG: hypothetical protein R2831_07160 [Chitinophagaceae bacterium]